jgi:hypothetical protein
VYGTVTNSESAGVAGSPCTYTFGSDRSLPSTTIASGGVGTQRMPSSSATDA